MELTGMQRADTAIVGGGLTGLLLAAALSHEGLRVIVLGAPEHPCKIALASFLNIESLSRIKDIHGIEAARVYSSARQSQLQALTEAPLPYVQELSTYLYARHPQTLPKLEQQQAMLTALNILVHPAPDAGGCPFPVELSLLAQGQALADLPQWNAALKRDIRLRGSKIFAVSPILSIDSHRICTAHGCVEASNIVLTTGVPLGLRDKKQLSLLETRLIACCELNSSYPLHSCQLPVEEGNLSLLPTADGALVLGDAGRLGMPWQRQRLQHFTHTLNTLLPDWQQGQISYFQSVHTLDGLPMIGLLPHSGLLCTAGIDPCDVLGAMHAAEVLTRRILGRTAPSDVLYAPARKLPLPFQRRISRRITGICTVNMFRRRAPACAHCHCRMRYSLAMQRWECPYCGTCYSMLGQPTWGPGLQTAHISVRQRPDI